MSRKGATGYRIVGPEVDLDREIIIDSKGRRIDQAYVDRAVAEVEDDIARQAGRPSRAAP